MGVGTLHQQHPGFLRQRLRRRPCDSVGSQIMGAAQGLQWVLPWQHQQGQRPGSWLSAGVIVCTGFVSGDAFAERDSSRLKV